VLVFVAVFQRFARPSAIFDAIATDSFGIFVVHYFFVHWTQYLLLDWDLPGAVKGVLVFAIALPLSWGCAALLRHLPFPFAALVGGGGPRSNFATRTAPG
jgi:glucans biosynthesis protein C